MAGFIDGEGSLFISKHRPIISVTSTHNMIIELCNTYGGTWFYVRKRDRPKEKPFYSWQWSIKMIRWYLPQLLPYFKIKSEQGRVMLEVLRYCRGTRGTEDESRKRKQKLEMYARKLHRLNQKAFPLEGEKSRIS